MENNDKFMDPFLAQGESRITAKKLALKLTSEIRGTKRYREVPQDYKNLLALVQRYANLQSAFKIEYTDDAGDVIAVSDDEDLLSAYEWADQQNTTDLKLHVSAKNDVAMQAELMKPLEAITIEEKKVETKSAPVYRQPNPQSAKPTERTVVSDKDDSSSSSDDEDEAEKKQAPGMLHNAIGIPKVTDDKKDAKKARRQKKAIRKIIKQSMMAHSRELI